MKTKKLIYFDNATTSLKLPSFIERLVKSYSDTSWVKDKEFYLHSLVSKLASWLGVTGEQITLVPSSTYAINEIFESLVVEEQIKVYLSESEHISNYASIWWLREKYPERIKLQHYNPEREWKDEQGVLLITLRDNLGNSLWTKEKLSKLPQELVVIGDFTQSVASDDLSEIKEHFDYFYFSAHKFLGPFGLGCIVSKKPFKTIPDLDWRSIYLWEQEFETILSFFESNKYKSKELIEYWVKNFPESSGFSYTHYPNSLIFLVKVESHSTHDFAYLLEEHNFVFRFNDLCSTNSLVSDKSLIRFSLSVLNTVKELEKLFELMRYFEKSVKFLK